MDKQKAPKKKKLSLKIKSLEKKTAPKAAMARAGAGPVIGYS